MQIFSLSHIAAIAVLVGLAGCAPAPESAGNVDEAAPVVAAALPGKVVWTDGHGDVAVGAQGKASCAALSSAETSLALGETNKIRAQAGLAPLRVNDRLQRAAAQHACEMASRGTMTHVGTETSGPSARVKALGYAPRVTAENIAAGRFGLVDVLAQWSASPRHRGNVVIAPLQEFGIGRAVGADGKTTFWAAVYAAPK